LPSLPRKGNTIAEGLRERQDRTAKGTKNTKSVKRWLFGPQEGTKATKRLRSFFNREKRERPNREEQRRGSRGEAPGEGGKGEGIEGKEEWVDPHGWV
jgi:hypothetical protein